MMYHFELRNPAVPAYLSFLLDLTRDRREKTLYVLVGSDLPTLVRVKMTVSKWDGEEELVKMESVVEEIDGIPVPREVQAKQTVVLETRVAPTGEEQAAVLRQSIARHHVEGRMVLADDIDGHLRVAALRRRLRKGK